MENYHKLLKRQIKKYMDENDDLNLDQFDAFFNAVSEAYYAFDDDRLMVERSLEISSHELNQVIEELRRTQGTLVNQEKMAAIGHLAAGIAHEINNPLGYLSSNISTLNKYMESLKEYAYEVSKMIQSTDDQRANEKLNYLMDKLQYMYILKDISEVVADSNEGMYKIKRIVNGLLNFSQNNEQEGYETVYMNECIENTLIITENELKNVAAVVKEYQEVPLIYGDSGEINQVILNLLLNAVYAIQETGQRGVIHIHSFTENEDVCVCIKDNGIGIPEDLLDTIFNPFFTTRPMDEGTGLGLSIAYDIVVNKYHGELTVTSKEGEGTVFKVKIPSGMHEA